MRTGRTLGCGLLATALCAATLACARDAPAPAPPNILLLISDDLGYPYHGFTGSRIVRTPNLDRLAREGVAFTRGFTTASACRLSLMSLLTGLYPAQWEARNRQLEREGADVAEFHQIVHYETLPRLLTRAGFATFQGGKYWEGTHAMGGFTHGTKDGSGERLVDVLAGGSGLELGRSTMDPVWRFLDEHAGRQPFFLWFAPQLPHHKFDPPQRLIDLYDATTLTRQARLYYANITRFDERVGELLRYLDDHDLGEDTLVVYLSDNGWEQPPSRETGFFGGDHGKNSIYELGFRTPIVFRWPGRLPQGVVRSDLVSTVDLFPTLLDFARVAVPEGRLGLSLRPRITGEEAAAPLRPQVIGSVRAVRRSDPESPQGSSLSAERAWFLRDPTWRYVWYPEQEREELYRIEEDPEERHDLAAEHPDLRLRYRREIESWREQLADPPADPPRS